MAEKDRVKWEEKYRRLPQLLEKRPHSPLVDQFHTLCRRKSAIDLACGTGRNSLFLAEKGFRVDAIDISPTALSLLQERDISKNIRCIEADLDTYMPDTGKYDLIVMMNYLDRTLIKHMSRTCSSGTLFLIETYVMDERNEKKDSNSAFMLKPGELQAFFSEGFSLLFHDSYWNEPFERYRMRKQAIAVRRI